MIVDGGHVRQDDEPQLRRVTQHAARLDEEIERRVNRRHAVA